MSDSTQQIVLHTSGLVVGYPKNHADTTLFEPLSLNLFAGELVCFMGSNGIGKTTLIKTLAGILRPLQGTVVQHKPTAVVLTDRINTALMTVRDLVTYGRYPYLNWSVSLTDADQELINSAITQVHLEQLADKRLDQLSDGQLQMAMIGMALAQDTDVLLLDEPTAHLDLNNRVEIMNLLRHLTRVSGKTILIATHELDLALQTADKIWLATPASKIVEGTPEDLVLNGTFDEVFNLKGFDLKTGKVIHTPYRNTSLQLEGTGYEYLWTKNALERNGYTIANSASAVVQISTVDTTTTWLLQRNNTNTRYHSLQDLIAELNR